MDESCRAFDFGFGTKGAAPLSVGPPGLTAGVWMMLSSFSCSLARIAGCVLSSCKALSAISLKSASKIKLSGIFTFSLSSVRADVSKGTTVVLRYSRH